MIIETEKGQKLEVPDGSTPEQIDEVLTNFVSGQKPEAPQAPEQSLVQKMTPDANTLPAMWEGIKSGAVPFSDEIQAGIAAYSSAPFVEGLTLADAYKQAKYGYEGQQTPGFLQQQQIAEQQNPGAYYTGMVGGAIPTTVGAIKEVGTIAPRISELISKNPKTAAAGLGLLSGGVYGAGTAEGTPGEIAKQAGFAGGVGMLAGPVGAVVGQRVASGVTSLASRAQRLFRKTVPSQAVFGPSALSGVPVTELPKIEDLTQKASVVRMPTGAATGNVDQMRIAEGARQGLLGPEYQGLMNQADELAQQDILNVTQSLASGKAGTPEETLMGGINMFQKRAAAEKRLNSKLMEVRNEKIAKAGVYKDYTKDTLVPALKDLAETPDFKVNTVGEAGKPIRDKLDYITGMMKKKTDDVNFAELSAWRRSLNNGKPGTQEGVFFGQMAKTYDDWLDNMTEAAFKNGDRDTVDTIFKANASYKQFKDKYGTNAYKGQSKIIQNILEKSDLDDSQIVNMAFGKKGTAGTDGTVQTVRRMIDAMPDERKPAMQEAFRSGLIQRALNDAYYPETKKLSLPILKNQLVALAKSPSYQKYLKTDEHEKVMNLLISDIDKVISSQSRRDVYSPSGGAVLRGVDNVLDGLGFLTSKMGGRAVTETIKKGTAAGKVRPDQINLEKQLADLVNTTKNNIPKTAQKYIPAISAGQAGSIAGQTVRPEPYITVTPKDKQ